MIVKKNVYSKLSICFMADKHLEIHKIIFHNLEIFLYANQMNSLYYIFDTVRPIKVQIDNDRQPVHADKPLDVVCRAFGSRPAASITWYKNGLRLYSTTDSQMLLNKKDFLKQQTVELTRRSFSSSVDEINHNSKLMQSRLDNENKLNNNYVDIQENTVNGGDLDLNVTTSTLTFVPTIEDGGQIITCKAENTRIQAPSPMAGMSIEDSWKLNVYYLPRVHLTLGEKLIGKPINEGHDVYFECSIKSHPSESAIRWWFNGKELETNLTQGIIISNQSLVLQRVNRQQRGRYTCSAINQVGESQSNSVHLQIQYAPFCRDTQQEKMSSKKNQKSTSASSSGETTFSASSQQRYKTHYGAARLESVKVYCHVDADPIDSISYKWAFVANSNSNDQTSAEQTNLAKKRVDKPEFSGQQLVYLDSNLISKYDENPLISVATYTPRSELDYGTLLCWAQNSIGKQTEPCSYQIVPADKPDPVRNCRLLNASDTQLIVSCEPGYDGGIDQSFQMEVYDSNNHRLVANISSSSSNYNTNIIKYETPNFATLSDQQQSSNSDNNNDNDDESKSQQQQQQPESLVSDDSSMLTSVSSSASKQQKQRHSLNSKTSQLQQWLKGAHSQPKTSLYNKDNHATETVFITEPILNPATDYFLSIYSSNQKGSSKPVAFTATTMNATTLTGSASTASNYMNTIISSIRDGRRVGGGKFLLLDYLSTKQQIFQY